MTDIFIGYDERDDKAFRVCESSLRKHATIPVRIRPLREHELRRRGYIRPYFVAGNGQMVDGIEGRPFSTKFSFTRFLIPHLMDYADDLVVYCDADMLWRADIAELVDLCQDDKAVWCVQHKHIPFENQKMDGIQQTKYPRKNWSSMVVWNPSRNGFLTPARVSELPGAYLHAFSWLSDDEFGALPREWNWLAGVGEPCEPKVVHYTLGSPDFPGHENAPYAAEWRREYQARAPSELERTLWSPEPIAVVSGAVA